MNKILFFLFCCCSFSAVGQDLTGIWRGHFRSSGNRGIEQLMGEEDRYKFEIQLNQRSKQFEGVTYSYKTTVFYGKATCTGAVNTGTKKVLLEELKIVEVRMAGGDACIMTCFLQYSKSGEEEFMEGSYTSMNTRDSSNCGRGTIFLRKVVNSDFHKEPFLVEREKEKATIKRPPLIAKSNPPANAGTDSKDNTVKKAGPGNVIKPNDASNKKIVSTPPPKKNTTEKKQVNPSTTSTQKPVAGNSTVHPPNKNNIVKIAPVDSLNKIEKKTVVTPKVLLSRENELIKTIETDANEITINLYDNGSIDNDTVSVYLDKKLVVARKRLTEKPISISFNLDENNIYHELIMVAENLGEIPPNTSLMVVKAGARQYEVRISSNEQKNAVVRFKYVKEN